VRRSTLGTASAAALGIAVSPLPALAVAALLGSSGALRAASAFVAGEALAVGAVAALVVLLAAGSLEGSLDSTLALVQLAIAAILVLLLIAHRRASQRESASGRVLATLDSVSAPVAFLSGVAMVAVNPKNLALALAGGAAILQLDQTGAASIATLLVFTAVAVSLLVAELLAYALSPRRATDVLNRGRELTLRHERVVVTVVLLALAVLLFTRGLLDLLG
jgi:threonine/homoserine/homoserine lactone efflux protein